jgi:hypothetical protein
LDPYNIITDEREIDQAGDLWSALRMRL